MTVELSTPFESELKGLIRDFFSETDYQKVCSDSVYDLLKSKSDRKISDLYSDKLDIKIEESHQRFSIDRTITYAEKKLGINEFNEFLWELGNICKISGKLNLAQEIFNKIRNKTLNKKLLAKTLISLADIYSRKAVWTKSISMVTEAESIYKSLNDSAGIANCLNLLGTIFGEMGDVEKANHYFNQGLVFASESSAQELNAKIETNIGVVNSLLGNTEEAARHLESAFIIYKKINDILRIAEFHLNFGLNYLQAGDLREAEASFNKGIAIAIENKFYNTLALLYHGNSQVFIKCKDFLMAKEFSDKALSISHYLDDKLTIADIYKVRGIISKYLNDFRAAESYFLISLRINTSLRNSINIAESSQEIASLYKEEGKIELSKQYYLLAMDYYKKCEAADRVISLEESINDLIKHSDSAEVNDEQ